MPRIDTNSREGYTPFVSFREIRGRFPTMPTTVQLSLHHLARVPAHAAATCPTVICLHGRGSNEADLIGLAPYLDKRLLWISPRAPLDLMGGYEWYRLEGGRQNRCSVFRDWQIIVPLDERACDSLVHRDLEAGCELAAA